MILELLIAILVILCLFLTISLFLFFTNKKVIVFFKNLRNKLDPKAKQMNKFEIKNFAIQLSGVLKKLSKDVVGGLIVVEKNDSLEDYIKLGFRVKADFSSEFVVNIFYNKQSPLHDGGLIVRNNEIISVSSYFPMTKENLATSYGARHRAAIGLTEEVDSLAFVVSETSGKISYAYKGQIHVLSNQIDELNRQVQRLLTDNSAEISNREIIIQDSLESK